MGTSNRRIADLHCDLLAFLASSRGDIFTPEVKCSWPQMKAGGVAVQTLALFTDGEHAPAFFQKQANLFMNLEGLYPDHFLHLRELEIPEPAEQVYVVPAIENASGLCGEDEALEVCFRRLDEFVELSPAPPLYISLTWNHENRFGGGNKAKAGLKRDGELLLEYLNGREIAIDLSHTSDRLAEGILNHIDKRGLALIPIASHSNFRAVCDQPRNVTDEIALEIGKRGGVIGLNFVKHFLGGSFKAHADHAKQLGLFDAFCFGADYFCEAQIVPLLPSLVPFFYKEFADASCYPKVLEQLMLTPEEEEQLAHRNLGNFFRRLRGGVHDHSR